MKLKWIPIYSAAFIVGTGAGLAQTATKTYVFSETLVNEIYTTLAKDPYSQVATVLSHLQAEVLKQPALTAVPEAPKTEGVK